MTMRAALISLLALPAIALIPLSAASAGDRIELAVAIKPQTQFGDAVAAYALQDFQRAAQIWQSLANTGDPESQMRLADMYRIGAGVPKDQAAADKLLRSAAKAGLTEAQLSLGTQLVQAKGSEARQAEGEAWLAEAASQGSAQAHFLLARRILAQKDGSEAAMTRLEGHLKAALQGLEPGPERKSVQTILQAMDPKTS